MPQIEPINILDPVFKSNPYDTYARLRADDPVRRATFPDGQEIWLVTRYADAVAALTDERLVKNLDDVDSAHGKSRGRHPLAQHMLNADPPDHTRLRNLVSHAFSPRYVEGLRGRVQAIADELLDAVVERRELDLVNAYAFPLQSTVISEMLGVPVEDQGRMLKWAKALFEIPTKAGLERIAPHVEDLTEYLRVTLERRRKDPGADLISALSSAEEDGSGRLTAQELLSTIYLLIIGGQETTVSLIGNGVFALLSHPEQLAKLKAAPSLIKVAVEELLRFDGGVEMTLPRYARQELTLGGVVIPKHATVVVALSSANRDHTLAADADRLDISRAPLRHVAFGHGVHFCLGASLARLVAQIAIGTLLRRAPDLRLKEAPEALVHRMTFLVRGTFEKLLVTF